MVDAKFYFKRQWIIIVVLCCSPSLFAAEPATTNHTNGSLQQQLQYLQESLEPSKKESQASLTPVAQSSVTPTQEEIVPQQTTALPISTTGQNSGDPSAVSSTPFPPDVIRSSGAQPGASSATAEASPADRGLPENDLRTQAFGKVLNTALPLSPSQIRLLRTMYDATQQAAVAYPGVPPRPTASSIQVSLSPGATPPVVRLGAGFVTSLVFVDSTGAPWPIDSYSLGNPTAFNIQWDKKSNILLVQAITAHRIGNLAVLLKGLNTPVMVDMNPGQAAMDVRVDLRIPGLGPQAKPIFDTLPGTESPALLALLDGIPPPGAKSLKSSACENCAWLVDKKLYLRTQFTVLSPAWISTMSSADGTHVYEMQPTPLVLVSYNGKTIKMSIEGF